MTNGSLYIPNKISKVFGRPSLMVISYRHLFVMAIYKKLWKKDAEIVSEPIGKCHCKLFRHCFV